jgi:hypothetical protein
MSNASSTNGDLNVVDLSKPGSERMIAGSVNPWIYFSSDRRSVVYNANAPMNTPGIYVAHVP